MRHRLCSVIVLCVFCLSGCIKAGPNPDDPYESINRKIYRFNMVLDRFIIKPPAEFYIAVVPPPIRAGVNNLYNNINMIPTFASDILQGELEHAITDFWRFVINTSLGLGGVFDVASHAGIPFRENDLGITFAKWGDLNSPYIMVPFLGPSTIRDSMGLVFEYTFFTPYPYVPTALIVEGVLSFRYVDLRSRMFDTDKLMREAPDPYSFMRDAYLQHRRYLIQGEEAVPTGLLYVEEDDLLSETPSEGN